MKFVQHINFLNVVVVSLILVHTSKASHIGTQRYQKPKFNSKISRLIVVDIQGHEQFTSVQKAIDSVPSNNTQWVQVQIKRGVYNEKVIIPKEKPYIFLVGENRCTTIIQIDETGSSTESAALILFANNFKAVGITFRNAYSIGKMQGLEQLGDDWAPAATIYGDQVSFHACGFVSFLDTLTDFSGRHYYKNCYIEGGIDFIWGYGQSVFKACTINATTGLLNGVPGYVAAQGRKSENGTGGFVFISSRIVATGPVYLGRPYSPYSRIVYVNSIFPPQIVPAGWDIWKQGAYENEVMVAEVNCIGPGANKSRRVKWLKQLTPFELNSLTNIRSFINQDMWIGNQPQIMKSRNFDFT